MCNREMKFGLLLQRARVLGMHLATGHYARIACVEEAVGVRYRLLRGLDRGKEQSYVLYMLDQEALAQTLFPLGEMTKAQVRAAAVRRGLPTAGRPESQEICFIPDDDYRRFLAQRLSDSVGPGPIRDMAGRVLGTHRGLPYYTIGQRKGLGLAQRPRVVTRSEAGRPAPLFVVAIDAAENALVVGPEEALLRTDLEAEEITFVSGQWPAAPLRVGAKVRYRSPISPATLTPLHSGRIHLAFDVPQRAITPGQAVVFYEGEKVLGGGIIC
jgi:tRNA-specific 2-thiouridylase